MKRLLICLTLALLFAGGRLAQSQAWSGLLAPNRAIDWSQAGAGVIPARPTVCTTLGVAGQAPTFAQSVSMASIASALSACPSGQTVLLNPGTYSTAASLVTTKSNVTLRGSGPKQTTLKFTGTSSNCLGIGPTAVCPYNGDSNALSYTTNVLTWTGGFSQGTTVITAGAAPSGNLCGNPSSLGPCSGSLSNLHVGSLITLNQLDDASDTGNAYFCGNLNCSQQGDGGNAWPGRSQIQVVTVTGISGSSITISPAIYAPQWSSGKSPYMTFSSSLPLSNFGLENMKIDTTSLGSMAAMVQFVWATNSWVKNVALINNAAAGDSAHKHVWVAASTHITVRDSYMYGASPSSEGYGVDFWESGDSLAENNICQHLPTCEIMEGGTGNVFGYDYAVDNYYTTGGGGWQQCDQFHHNAGDYYNLWEGNIGTCHTEDSIHGTAFANTVFRNALSGFDPNASTKNLNLLAFNTMGYARYNNYFLNVIGFGGHQTTYQYVMASLLDCGPGSGNGLVYGSDDTDQNVSAFVTSPCGYTHNDGSDAFLDNDKTANAAPSASTARWGTWDAVTGTVRTNSGETASTASTYPGLATASTAWSSFPSLYLPGSPAWWNFQSGSVAPFPAIGPEVTGGNIAGSAGHAWLNPAANNYLKIMGGATDGSSGPLAFDGSVYYSGGTCAIGFSPAPGTYTGTQSVTISTAGCPAGTQVFYRIDGLPATNIDTLYAGPISVSSSQTLTAKAVLNPTIRNQPQTISANKKCNSNPLGPFPSGLTCQSTGGVAGTVSDANNTPGSSNQLYVTTTSSATFDISVLFIDTPPATDNNIVEMSHRIVFQDSTNGSMTGPNLYKSIDVSEFDAESCCDATTHALWQMSARGSTNAPGSSGNNGFLEGDASSGNEKWDIPYVIGSPTDVTVNSHWTLGDTGCGGSGCMVLDSIYLNGTLYPFPASCDPSDTNCATGYPMTPEPSYGHFVGGSQDQVYARSVSVAGTSPLTTTRNISFARVGVDEGTEATGSAAYHINALGTPTNLQGVILNGSPSFR